MSTGLFGALTPDEVTPIHDDGEELRAAARKLHGYLDQVHGEVQDANRTWADLPSVLYADRVTPALEPLMDPAITYANRLRDAAEDFLRVASSAADDISDLKKEHDQLVADIEQFHASAPGVMAAHAAQQAASGNLLGAVATVVTSWKDVPQLVGDEVGLRWRLNSYEDKLSSTMARIAGRIEAVDVSTPRLPDIGSARSSARLLDEGLAPAAVAALAGTSLAGLLRGMSGDEIEDALKKNKELRDWVKGLSASEAQKWWNSLDSSQQAAATTAIPAIIGALGGIPAGSRVAANKINAKNDLPGAQKNVATLQEELSAAKRLTALDNGASIAKNKRIAKLEAELKVAKHEVAFLKSATGDHPSVQLYLFDPKNSRIIQMLGTPSAATKHVITYVPGTFTSMDSFYGGSAQQVAAHEVATEPDSTVAFVYKDGKFPGENDATSAANLLRIEEANNAKAALADGGKLADFQTGLSAADPELAKASTVAMGHSWGLTDVTSSEVAGAHYNQVISLSGAGMLPQWHPETGTTYSDFSYNDILQQAQRLPFHPVWSGDVPRANDAFQHGAYYVNTDGYTGWNPIKAEGQLLANHSLIATDSPANQRALAGITKQVFSK